MRAVMIAASVWLCACAATGEAQDIDPPISLVGEPMAEAAVGSLFINMRIQDARVLGFSFQQGATDGDCSEWTVLPLASNGAVTVLTYRGMITRISVTGDIGIRTTRGIALGSSSADVIAAYPNAVSENAEYFAPPAREIYVWSDAENLTGLHFVINEQDQVGEMQAGGELRNIEGCAPSP